MFLFLYNFLLLSLNMLFHLVIFFSLHPLQSVFIDDPDLIIEDVDFNDTHMVFIVREGRKFRICSVALPLPRGKVRHLVLLWLCLCI